MKQGILITAYKNVAHLLALVQAFDGRFSIYIHIDKKSADYDTTALALLGAQAQVVFISRHYAINWGGINHTRAILLLCREALKDPSLEYLHLITGHDFPIKSCDAMSHYLEQHKGEEFFDYFEIPNKNWTDGGMNRVSHYHFYDQLNARKYQKRLNQLVRLQQRLGITRPLDPGFPKLYGGSTYWSLSRACLQYAISYCDAHPSYLRRFRFTFCPEEFFFQTILMNSPFAGRSLNSNMRYIDWTPRNGNCPANLDRTDYEKLRDTSAFFARKFEYPVSQELRHEIERLIVTEG